MNTSQINNQGCGSGSNCSCGSKGMGLLNESPMDSPIELNIATAAENTASINGIYLHTPGHRPDEEYLRELAHTEILRQHAVGIGLLPYKDALQAPQIDEYERNILETMVNSSIHVPTPTEFECQRYFDSRKSQYVSGQAVHLRHILFAVTPGVNVQALSVYANNTLISLLEKNVPVELFAKMATELSNCPSSTLGGDLGWVGPQDCAPELATILFFQTGIPVGLGLQPRLIHTRFGFHIIDVLELREGKAPSFSEVRERVSTQLMIQLRVKALREYMSNLAEKVMVEGLSLNDAYSPLVQ